VPLEFRFPDIGEGIAILGDVLRRLR